MATPKTLFEKIWDAHVVRRLDDGREIIHIDRHLIHEATSQEAFAKLEGDGERVRRPDLTYGCIDHIQSTLPGRTAATYPPSQAAILAMQANCRAHGVRLFDLDDPRQGIVHVVGPELGIALPGTTLACGDSHTATNGGVGALAWGIGTTEVQQVLATQALIMNRPRTMRVTFRGRVAPGVAPKDLILYLIGRYGVAAGTGHSIEYAGPAIAALPIEGRLTICNMSIEFGARSGLVAPDDTTIEYLAGRPYAPKAGMWDRAVEAWRALSSDPEAVFDTELEVDCDAVTPQVSWGTSPQDVAGIDQPIPDPDAEADRERRSQMMRSLQYMDLRPGMHLTDVPVDVAFIGSCTNSRLSDLQAAAEVLRGRKVADGVRALAVPGSGSVKRAAEALGLDRIFRDAGFEWHEAGCSMCVAANGDVVGRGQRSIATSNRNFENRQGPQSRTHLASPATVAASAVLGRIADARRFMAPGGDA